jgi:quinol monooxygenase YgiN
LSFLTVEFLPRSKKHREFLLTIQPLVEMTLEEQGCKSARLFHDAQDQIVYLLVGDWESPGHLDRYLQSDLFQVLLGTASLLRERPKIRVNGISPETMRAIDKVNPKRGAPAEPPGP